LNGEAGPRLIFPWKAPVLNPRPEFALPYRIHEKPAGGPSPAGANFFLGLRRDKRRTIEAQPRRETFSRLKHSPAVI
jgi:hypothetical protein